VLLLSAVGGLCPSLGYAATSCAPVARPGLPARAVTQVLDATRDVWGSELLAEAGGPTLASAQRLLPPLFYARAAHRRSLTSSGAYYLPFAEPVGRLGAGSVELHLADGSQIVAGHIGGRALTIGVGPVGRERFGSCLARLAPPALADGYLPILETRYRDASGALYEQESFAATLPALGGLASFVRLQVESGGASDLELRLSVSGAVTGADRGGLLDGGETLLLATAGGGFSDGTLSYRLAPDTRTTIYAVFLARPRRVGDVPAPSELYREARATAVAYWRGQLRRGASVETPEPLLDDAEKALLIQNLVLSYRYSVGNAYQEFSFPESIDVARVMGEWGFTDTDESILRLSFSRRPTPYPNWTRGEKLLAVGEDWALSRDERFLLNATPTLAGYLSRIARELGSDGLLPPEQYSSDIPLKVRSLPGQAVVWQGLEAVGRAWAAAGEARLARRSFLLAAKLRAGLLRAVGRSEQRLSDGSLFVPAILLGGERAYGSLTRSRLGSYWNLVMPYAFASGLFPAGGSQARGIVRYLTRHGALLLGLVRAGAYALYGHDAPPTRSGTDEVYGTNLARFFAANGEGGELDLALYGQLAAAMTPGTFVAGEAASVAPLPGEVERAMYLPPNSASNASLLETLRLTVVDETVDSSGAPTGLELGYFTPPAWLEAGHTLSVTKLPTSFGPVSYELSARRGAVAVSLSLPPRRPRVLRLRLRLPAGERIATVSLDGTRYRRVAVRSDTIDLSGLRRRRVVLEVKLSG
jgi:hypothetical protein